MPGPSGVPARSANERSVTPQAARRLSGLGMGGAARGEVGGRTRPTAAVRRARGPQPRSPGVSRRRRIPAGRMGQQPTGVSTARWATQRACATSWSPAGMALGPVRGGLGGRFVEPRD